MRHTILAAGLMASAASICFAAPSDEGHNYEPAARGVDHVLRGSDPNERPEDPIYEQGVAAREGNLTEFDCPYGPGRNRDVWLEGFNGGDADTQAQTAPVNTGETAQATTVTGYGSEVHPDDPSASDTRAETGGAGVTTGVNEEEVQAGALQGQANIEDAAAGEGGQGETGNAAVDTGVADASKPVEGAQVDPADLD